jgi:hypothetical protein
LFTARKELSPVHTSQIFQAWGKILKGEYPSVSIEITTECPLKCPGCYAYDAAHLGGGQTLRDLNDRRGQSLVDGVLEVVDRLKPLHLSIVGGDPLVRYRELELMIPPLLARGIHVQVVTSAFRTMGPTWPNLERLYVVVSIDGLQPEHDARRAPATYDRILRNITGQRITVHCTITGQMMKRPGYLGEFLKFWTPRPEIKKVWFSLFTPQVGDKMPEILSAEERQRAITEMVQLRKQFPKLDMSETVLASSARHQRAPKIVFSCRRPRRCRRTWRQRSLHVNLAEILIARPVDVLRLSRWLESQRTNWEGYSLSGPFSKLPRRSARTGRRKEAALEGSIKVRIHFRYCR